MKTLFIHAGSFKYEVKDQAIPNPENVNSNRTGESENVLVIFTTIEAEDGKNPEGIIKEACKTIIEIANQIGVSNILLYPYAHLSSSLADKETSLTILKEMQVQLSNEGFNVERSPFGWYKSFTLNCLGHPLSELSRTISAQPKPKKIVSTIYKILDLDGQLFNPSEYKFKSGQEEFRALVNKEALKIELPGGNPKFLDYCTKFGVEWETYSDVGHMRYSPEATLMFDLIGDYAWNAANDIGIPILQLKGTNMFNLAEKPVREHANLFGDKLYEMEIEKRKLVLRYAACHQQFSSVKDWNISYKQIPFGTFEIADSYRLEQSGELLLCFRVRKLHMPDLHIYCRNMKNAQDVSLKLHKKIYEEIRKLNREYVSIYNTTETFFKKNREFFNHLLDIEKKPILLNFVPENLYYWVINVEYTIIDELNRPREIATFQIDMGNAKRFDIAYIDKNSKQIHPPIIHTAIIGTIERFLFTIFDCAVRAEKHGKKPSLPLWLAPIQARIIPVSQDLLNEAIQICHELNEKGVRTDIDDRNETLAKRIRTAETKWIPYIITMGERELKKGVFSTRIREKNTIKDLKITDLVIDIKQKTKNYPYRPLIFPESVSLRSMFN